MQLLKELSTASKGGVPPNRSRRPSHSRTLSNPGLRSALPSERQPLVRRRSFDEYENNVDDISPEAPVAGGTILGVHNLAIVLPQFIVWLNNMFLNRKLNDSYRLQ